MSDKGPEVKLSVVKFNVQESRFTRAGIEWVGTLKLSAKVRDKAMWESVVRKMAVLRLYDDDITNDARDLMCEEMQHLEQENARLKRELAQARDGQERASAELRRYRKAFEDLDLDLG